ncbi:MAG: helix-turn-helix transcriptional regulator [Clostridia bacterium]|nr:helix-turn-helix transcriptional regulator [Clostridia bacterium]
MRALIMDFPSSLLAASFFKAFSDGTRLRLLQALSIREMCVSDLCALLELNQPAVSNHLRILSNQRIVKSRRSGKNIFYSLDDWHINAIIGMAMEHLSFACPD